MKLQHRLYATTQGCATGDAARELLRAAGVSLDELYEQGVIAGYKLLVLETESDYEDQDLDRPAIERETGGQLPVLFLNVTYRDEDPPPDLAAVDPLITKYALRYLTESDDP